MHSRLEQYLQTVEQNLQHLPTYERQNELNEIRLHLESLVEANIELGETEEEAVTQTLNQFGRAQTLGKDLTHVHRGKPSFQDLAAATAFNYVGGSVTMLLVSRLLVLSVSSANISLWIVRSLVTMFCVDWLTGAVMPRGAVKGAVYARLLGAGISLLLSLRLQSHAFGWQLASSAINSTIHVALALVGAKLGVHWRKKHRKTMRVAH